MDAKYQLPANVRATGSAEDALKGADFILHTVPVQYSRETLKLYAQWIGDTPIISASKGIETGSLMYMSQLVPDTLGRNQRMAFLSGPSFAKELVEDIPTAVVAASEGVCVFFCACVCLFVCVYVCLCLCLWVFFFSLPFLLTTNHAKTTTCVFKSSKSFYIHACEFILLVTSLELKWAVP